MIRLPIAGEGFGRYRLLRKLGQGGMGVVYAAHDTSLDREVAVKLVVPHLAGDEGFRARFQHEAATLARLESPRIVRIYDHGEHDEMLFLVTQLVAGGDLHALINREGSLPPGLAVGVLAQVVEGLCDAHAVGVVHRDIKPANVLLRERGREFEAFLCDFGIATTPGAELSRTGTVAGSLPYMAPERHQGEEAGPQGDVYAAGCLLWHALTGAAPYAGTDVEVAMAHMQAPVPQLPGKDEFSRAANKVLAKAMAKDRKKRYPTARALLTELTQLAALAPDSISLPGATAIRQPVPIGRRPRRWVPAAAAAVAVLAVIGTAVVAGGAIGSRDRTTADRPTLDADPTASATGDADPMVVDRPTLVPATPRPKGSGAPLPWETQGTDEGMLPDLLGAAEAGAPPAAREARPPARSAAPRPRRTVRPPRQTRTRTATATATATATNTTAPKYYYRCWNGVEARRYGDCSLPVGRAGADWVFSGFSNLSCRSYDIRGTRAERQAWLCKYDRGRSYVTFARWSSLSAARAHYGPGGKAWTCAGGMRCGWTRWHTPGSRFHAARVYSGGNNWSVNVNARTHDKRAQGLRLAGSSRAPNRLRGVPL